MFFTLDSLSVPFKNFFMGVCRFADNNIGPPPLSDYLPPSSVLHHLSAELYSVFSGDMYLGGS